MKSKTLIEKQTKRKFNPELVETIREAKKNEGWLEVAGILSTPRRKRTQMNLEKINEESKVGDVVVIPGKVLSQGEMDKRVKVVAFSFSENAKEKLKKAGCVAVTIIEEIKSNPEAKGIKILR